MCEAVDECKNRRDAATVAGGRILTSIEQGVPHVVIFVHQ